MPIPDPNPSPAPQAPHQGLGISGLTNEPDPPFWRPNARELIRILGWRNIFFLPALLTLLLPVVAVFIPPLFTVLIYLGPKLVVLLAVPIALAAYAIRIGVQSRKDPFCIHCGYTLVGLPAVHACPECGRPYDISLCDDYRRDRASFIHRFRQIRQPMPPSQILTVPPGGAPASLARRHMSRTQAGMSGSITTAVP